MGRTRLRRRSKGLAGSVSPAVAQRHTLENETQITRSWTTGA